MTGAIAEIFVNPRLHHVGIISPSEKRAQTQMAKLGLVEDFRGYVEKWDVLCIFTRPNGVTPIEFVVPFSGPLRDFNKRLGGLHHIALTVADIRKTMRDLAQNGIRTIEDEPVKGAGAFLCNFLHPIFTGAFSVEIVEPL